MEVQVPSSCEESQETVKGPTYWAEDSAGFLEQLKSLKPEQLTNRVVCEIVTRLSRHHGQKKKQKNLHLSWKNIRDCLSIIYQDDLTYISESRLRKDFHTVRTESQKKIRVGKEVKYQNAFSDFMDQIHKLPHVSSPTLTKSLSKSSVCGRELKKLSVSFEEEIGVEVLDKLVQESAEKDNLEKTVKTLSKMVGKLESKIEVHRQKGQSLKRISEDRVRLRKMVDKGKSKYFEASSDRCQAKIQQQGMEKHYQAKIPCLKRKLQQTKAAAEKKENLSDVCTISGDDELLLQVTKLSTKLKERDETICILENELVRLRQKLSEMEEDRLIKKRWKELIKQGERMRYDDEDIPLFSPTSCEACIAAAMPRKKQKTTNTEFEDLARQPDCNIADTPSNEAEILITSITEDSDTPSDEPVIISTSITKDSDTPSDEPHQLPNAQLNNGHFLDTDRLIEKLLQAPTTDESDIPPGIKENVYFLLNNTKNVQRRNLGKKAVYHDDCGVYSQRGSMKTHYFIRNKDGTYRYAEKKNGVYVTTKKKERVEMQPQPSEESILVLKRLYSELKRDPSYKRRVSWAEKFPADKRGDHATLCIEYIGSYPKETSKHGNTKSDGSSHYVRTRPEVRENVEIRSEDSTTTRHVNQNRPRRVLQRPARPEASTKCEVSSAQGTA
ncbi:uncharacterized protein LOC143017704 isoform X2 [Oratosquilla oratoria]|uniref:uncharacterized protein LOC143017704 isoform X2 n=1 Tax=Oratosquilla oratoria TaxID=337810 RepID=UPI003F75BF0F